MDRSRFARYAEYAGLMRVPETALKCVGFIGLPEEGGGHSFRGTAFMVRWPMPHIDPRASIIYVVTARHVADKIDGKNWVMRLNTTDGKYVDAVHSGVVWRRHIDLAVDVAAFTWKPHPRFDYRSISTDLFLPLDLSLTNCGVGDETFAIGIFRYAKGRSRATPIVRMGNLAMVPDGKIPTGLGLTDAYLIEARSLGGLSGAPVFLRESLRRLDGITAGTSAHIGLGAKPGDDPSSEEYSPLTGNFKLLGLLNGHWNMRPEDQNQIEFATPEEEGDKINVGIAVVTPAAKILELLESPWFSDQRDRVAAEHLARKQ